MQEDILEEEQNQQEEVNIIVENTEIENLTNELQDVVNTKTENVEEQIEEKEEITEEQEEVLPNLKYTIDAAYRILSKIEEEKNKDEEIEEPKTEEEEKLPEEEPEPEEPKEEIKEEEIKEPKIELDVENKNIANSNEEIKYEVKIKNTGNTEISDFEFYNIVDSSKVELTKMYVGDFNYEASYNVYYKTNMQEEYILLEEELSSKTNNLIEFDKVKLRTGEAINEIKIKFESAPVGFESMTNMQIFMNTKELNNNVKILNYSILQGRYNEIKISEDLEKMMTVYNVEIVKKLPKTGH